jgi:hypothetical protein
LLRTLTAALAPRRWEPSNPHNDHRAYPSPRSFFLTEVSVASGERRWMVDPVRATLIGDVYSAPIERATIGVHPVANRLPEGYGPMREAVALLEAGHVLGAICEAAGAAGLTAESTVDCPIRTDDVDGRAVAEIELRTGRPSWPMRRVLAARSSGLGAAGRLGADPRPLPAAALQDLIAGVTRLPAGSLAEHPAAAPLRHHLAIRGVHGCADGLYQIENQQLRRRSGDAVNDLLQDAFRFPRDLVDVAGMNVVWVVTVDIAAAVRAGGPGAYPAALLATGAFAQHAASAAALAGMFCRPVRSFCEAATEAAVRADPGQDAVYMLLIGRDRSADFSYDLTDPQGVLP